MDVEKALKKLFSSAFSREAESFCALKGDGSNRSIFRLSAGEVSAIGVFGPDAKENAAFLGFSRHFRERGLPVPEVLTTDESAGVYLLEDLGDTTLFDFLSHRRSGKEFPKEAFDLYKKAVETLPRFQIEAGRGLDYSLCTPRSKFDKQSMLWDLNYFKYNFLKLAQIPFDEAGLEADFAKFAARLAKAPAKTFLYRDFQSRNIMVRGTDLAFIDYQGGRKGAPQYDLASLLYDAKADVPARVRADLLKRYLKAAAPLGIEEAAFMEYWPDFVLVRILQALGTYGLRGFYERKEHFLKSIPYAVGNIESLLRGGKAASDLPELRAVLKRIVGSSRLRQFGQAVLGLSAHLRSFSYRTGVPKDEGGHGGGYVFDCRVLPNPGRQERYAQMTGKDAEIIEYLEAEPSVRRFLDHAKGLVDLSVEDYNRRNFTDLSVAFGCTGGRHRSVYCAERMAEHLREKYRMEVDVRHIQRELEGEV